MGHRINPGIAHQVIAGEAVLVDLAGAVMLGLNPSGSLVWSLLPEHDEEEIARALCERFAVDVEAARTDVRDFVADLVRRGIVLPADR